jgi:hypothetical protein
MQLGIVIRFVLFIIYFKDISIDIIIMDINLETQVVHILKEIPSQCQWFNSLTYMFSNTQRGRVMLPLIFHIGPICYKCKKKGTSQTTFWRICPLTHFVETAKSDSWPRQQWHNEPKITCLWKSTFCLLRQHALIPLLLITHARTHTHTRSPHIVNLFGDVRNW